MQPYEEYLKSVFSDSQRSGGQFMSEKDVIARYETLEKYLEENMQRQQHRNELMQEFRDKYFQLTKVNTTTAMFCSSRILTVNRYVA